jgi:uncharacterized protein
MSTNASAQGLGIDDIIGDKRNEILRLAEQYGAYNVRVFGSVARGEAQPESDVDILIDLQDNVNTFNIIRLGSDLVELLGRNVDVVLASDLRPILKSYVLKDATPL